MSGGGAKAVKEKNAAAPGSAGRASGSSSGGGDTRLLAARREIGNQLAGAVLSAPEREAQGSPKSQEQDEAWAAELARDESRLVAILTSVYYSDDDEAETIAILQRWAARRSNSAAALGIGMRSDLLDRLLERLRRTPVTTWHGVSNLTGRSTAYEAMFSSFARAEEIRTIRDMNSQFYAGREEAADEAKARREEEDLFAESFAGWQVNSVTAAPSANSRTDIGRARMVVMNLERIPPDRLTPQLRLISEGVSREGINFLLRRTHVVTAGDHLRDIKGMLRSAVVSMLELAIFEMTMGVAELLAPEILEGLAAGTRTAETLKGTSTGARTAEVLDGAVAGRRAAGALEGTSAGSRIVESAETTAAGRAPVKAAESTTAGKSQGFSMSPGGGAKNVGGLQTSGQSNPVWIETPISAPRPSPTPAAPPRPTGQNAVALSKSQGYSPVPLPGARLSGSLEAPIANNIPTQAPRTALPLPRSPYLFPSAKGTNLSDDAIIQDPETDIGEKILPGRRSTDSDEIEPVREDPKDDTAIRELPPPRTEDGDDTFYQLASALETPGLYRIDKLSQRKIDEAWRQMDVKYYEGRHVLLVDVNGKSVVLAVSGSGGAQGHTEYAAIKDLLEKGLLKEGDWMLMQGVFAPCPFHSSQCGMCRDVLNLVSRELNVEIIYSTDALRQAKRENESKSQLEKKTRRAFTYGEAGKGLYRRSKGDYAPRPTVDTAALRQIRDLIRKAKTENE